MKTTKKTKTVQCAFNVDDEAGYCNYVVIDLDAALLARLEKLQKLAVRLRRADPSFAEVCYGGDFEVFMYHNGPGAIDGGGLMKRLRLDDGALPKGLCFEGSQRTEVDQLHVSVGAGGHCQFYWSFYPKHSEGSSCFTTFPKPLSWLRDCYEGKCP